jgi:fructokinase
MPKRIVVGGGVMQHPGLLDKVRARTLAVLNGYLQLPKENYIVSPKLGDFSGVTGALALAVAASARTDG